MAKGRFKRGAYRLGHKIIRPICRLLFGFVPPEPIDLSRPTLVIPNHTFDLDFMLMLASFPRKLDFVAGETLFRNKFLRWLLFRLHDPLVIKKGGRDMRAVLRVLQRLRAGQSVCLFAEGNTTYDGLTGRIPAGTANLVRASGADLITLRVHGGYFTQPRWGHSLRRGKTWLEVAGRYPREALAAMSEEDVRALLVRDLHVDAADVRRREATAYKGKNMAEGLENLLYLCPDCGAMNSMQGRGGQVLCAACGKQSTYTQGGQLEGAVYPELKDWAAWQRERLRLMAQDKSFSLEASGQSLRLVKEDHTEEEIDRGVLHMDWQGLRLGDFFLPMQDIAGLSIFRNRRILISAGTGEQYEITSENPRNALIYRDFYDIVKGEA